MSEERWSEARRRMMQLAARAVAAARAATAEPSEPASDDAEPEAPDVVDDGTARIERELAAEREKTEALLGTIKELEFKLEVLEKSYSKQLTEARAHGDAVAQQLSETKTQLADTADELKRVTAVRDRLHDMISFDGRRLPPELRGREPGEEDTIARLLSVGGAASDAASPQETPDNEPSTENLLAPELVFDPNDDRDGGDDRE